MTVFKATILSMRSYIATFIVYLAIFFIFTLVRANLSDNTSSNMYKDTSLDLYVINNDDSNFSKALVDYLKATQKVSLTSSNNIDYEELNDNVRFEIYDYVLIIPDGFDDAIYNGNYEDSLEYIGNPNLASSYLITEKINTFLSNIVSYLNCSYDESSAIEISLEQIRACDDIECNIINNKGTPNNSADSSLCNTFIFGAYSSLMILTVCIGSILVFMKNKDLKERIIVSGTSFTKRYLGIISAIFTLGIAIVLVIIIIAGFIGHNQDDFNKILLYSVNEFFLMFVGLGIAYFISSITNNDNIINMISNMLVLSMSFLCGVFVPSEFMSESIVSFSHFLPLYWFVDATKYIASHNFNEIFGPHFFVCLLIQLAYAIIFFVAGIIIQKKKEQYAY